MLFKTPFFHCDNHRFDYFGGVVISALLIH